MADVKISALPLASTPLAGTEVLPIVQSATTDQVSVANLTAGRAVSAASLTLTTPLAAANGGTGIASLGTGVATALGNSVNGASGIVVEDSNSNISITGTVAMGSSFKRNRIINGNMAIAQRGTSITVGAASYTYTLDRYKSYSANSSTTVSQNTSAPTGFQYSLKLQRPASNTGTNSLSSVQIIETANMYDLAGQNCTLSFYAKSGANYSGGALTVQILTGTTADQGGDPYSWAGLASPINTTQAITSSWTRYSFTGTVGASVLEMAPVFGFTPTGTAGADDSVYITGIQLEVGSVATPYERQIYSEQLAQCQRYLPACKSVSTNGIIAVGQAYNTTDAIFSMFFQVTPRVVPTGLTVSSASHFTNWQANTSPTTPTAISFNQASFVSATFTATGGSGLVAGNSTSIFFNNSAGNILFTGCEL